MEIKIFEIRHTAIGEKEWVAAYSIVGAIKCLCNETMIDLNDLEDDVEIVELSRDKWGTSKVTNTDYSEDDPEDWKEKTVKEWLEEHGNKPCYIAGTMHY